MRNTLFTGIALLGLAVAAPAFASQDSGNYAPANQGPFVTASQDSGNTGLSNEGTFVTAGQDSGNFGPANQGAFVTASQDSGNLPSTLRTA